jgi:phage N-6-adenine-methyltransferase
MADALLIAAPSVTIDPAIKALIPPPTEDEQQLLEQSLVRDGCLDPLVVWEETGHLLDGHTRYAICKRLGITYRTTELSFATLVDAKLWVIQHQLGRRNLSTIDRIALARQWEPLIRTKAAANQGTRTDLPQNSAGGFVPVETRKEAAAIAGVSHATYAQGKVILEQGVPELVQAVGEGSASIHAAAAVSTLPAEEQREAVRTGRVTEEAKHLRAHIARSTGNDEWYTPIQFVEAARTVLGGFDVDPASNDIAQKAVKAGTFFTKQDNGLGKPWLGRIWLNPPYSRQLIGKFIDKLLAELDSGHTTAAILLVNAQTDAAWFQRALLRAAAVAFPEKRIRFLRPNGKPSEHGPLQGQAFLYFGADPHGFAAVFDQFGAVLLGNAVGKEVVA